MNTVNVNLAKVHSAITRSLYQYDYGQKLQIVGLELPQSFEVHFALKTGSTTITVLGADNVVSIPDELLQAKGDITAYIYLHGGDDDGETKYVIRIPVKERPQPSDYEPTPVEQDIITQTVAALNTAVDYVDTIAENISDTIVDAVETELATGKYNGKDGAKGEKGDKGDTGAKGDKGDTGIGIPVGGTTGQVLAKASDADYDIEWVNQSGDSGGTSDYTDLTNKPKINNVELSGNKSLADLGIVIPTVPVQSVNGKTGVVVLNASDVGALPSSYTAPVTSVNSKTGLVNLTANDVGAISTEVDPTVPAWAKQPSKPSYTASEVGALPSTTVIPSKTSQLQNDSGFLTSAPVSSVNGMTGAVVIPVATTSADGLMSAQDKSRLDALYNDYSSALTALGV